ncbi:hypothetical protein PENSPDRAFT_670924 [Peniophora sp. CONT]|nr:hypothetical protein PENSPDRAFT_670924 [Peniophora sp. CONT]
MAISPQLASLLVGVRSASTYAAVIHAASGLNAGDRQYYKMRKQSRCQDLPAPPPTEFCVKASSSTADKPKRIYTRKPKPVLQPYLDIHTVPISPTLGHGLTSYLTLAVEAQACATRTMNNDEGERAGLSEPAVDSEEVDDDHETFRVFNVAILGVHNSGVGVNKMYTALCELFDIFDLSGLTATVDSRTRGEERDAYCCHSHRHTRAARTDLRAVGEGCGGESLPQAERNVAPGLFSGEKGRKGGGQ